MRPIFVILAAISVVAFGQQTLDEISVKNFKIGFLAKDQQPSAESVKSIATFSKSSSALKGDAFQRLYVTFEVSKKSDGSKLNPEQVFLRFEHASGADAIVVVNPAADKTYALDQSLRTLAKNFDNLSGDFKASLVIGGAKVKTPINWEFASVEMLLPTVPVIIPETQKVVYDMLPTIDHKFREAEKRPLKIVSDVFTILCLIPLAALIFTWIKIGVNLKNAPVSVYVPLFHGGLTGVFVIYFLFWIQFDMFRTLNYMAICSVLTFIAGHRVLRKLAGEHMKNE